MTVTATDRLALPLLAAGQAQKEITHNEALTLLDMLIQPVVLSADLATPPAAPEAGQCWIIAAGATGAWEGEDKKIAAWTDSGWRYADPAHGWSCWVIDRGGRIQFDGNSWVQSDAGMTALFINGEKVLATRQPAISNPAGGTSIDDEARNAIIAILSALRTHGLIAA
jgi:hypothetical protein